MSVVIDDPLEPFLREAGVVVLDGALATELETRGADLRDALWSAKLLIESPDLIRQAHLDYFDAGADVAITASYQATFPGFAKRGIVAEDAAALMRRSVTLAQEARDAFWEQESNREGRLKPIVAASIGCYGAYLADGAEYRGDYGLSLAELTEFHRPRLECLADSGADLLACETIPCRVEAEALVELLRERSGTPAWLSFSCRDESRLNDGGLFRDCIDVATSAPNVVAVGLNCTAPQYATSLLRIAAAVTDKPLVAYPNSGEVWDADARTWRAGTGEDDFGSLAREWYETGARLIGGCCRTRPETVRQIRRALLGPNPVAHSAP